MILPWIKFIGCAVLIFFAGKRVAKYGDIISEKTGLGGLWIGILLVAVATSLPELFTGIGSVVFVDAPDITVGNLFGANSYNLLNIALLDILYKGSPILSSLTRGQLLTAGLSLIPLSIAALGIFLSQHTADMTFLNMSIWSILILGTYLMSTRIIFTYERKQSKLLKVLEKESKEVKYGNITLKKAYMRYALSAAVIIGAGIWLSYIGDELAKALHLEQSFIGSLFLGFATTLPEITVSIAALRIGAKELAAANMFGSNLFNMAIIFIDDLLYKKPIFGAVSGKHLSTALPVIIMTIIIIGAMIIRPKRKTRLGISLYSFILILVFIAGAYLNFIL